MLKRWLEKVPVVSNLYLLLVVLIGWVIFRFSDIRLGAALVKSMFGLGGNALTSFTSQMQLQSHMFLLTVAILASTPLMRKLKLRLEPMAHEHGAAGLVWDIALYSVVPVALLLICTACLVGDSYNPFIYFQF